MIIKKSMLLGIFLFLPFQGYADDNPDYCPSQSLIKLKWDKLLLGDSIRWKGYEYEVVKSSLYIEEGKCKVEPFMATPTPSFYKQYSHPCGYRRVCDGGFGSRLVIGRPK